jgi:hypothetical protein
MDGDVGNGVMAARKSPQARRFESIDAAVGLLAAGSVDRLSQTLVTR